MSVERIPIQPEVMLETMNSDIEARPLSWRSRVPLITVLALLVLAIASAAVLVGCGGQDDVAEAKKAEQSGDLSGALDLYQQRLENHPDDVEAVKGVAAILYMQRRWDEALPVQQKAVSLDPEEAQIRVELGFNYLNHQGDPAAAMAIFEEASELEPTAQYLTFLAQAQAVAGDVGKAEATLRSALAADRTYPRAYSLLIALLENQGEDNQAAQVRQAAESAGVALQPEDSAP